MKSFTFRLPLPCTSVPVFLACAVWDETELLSSLRLLFSRLAVHRCPNGHEVPPSLAVAAEKELICPTCGAHFYAPSAEELSFNSQGACPRCEGTGKVKTVNVDALVLADG